MNDGNNVTSLNQLSGLSPADDVPLDEGDFVYAPPIKNVDGLTAVPIDIKRLDVHAVFDMSTRLHM